MRKIKSIAYYITAHGYGHGVRSCDVIRALLREAPEIRLQVVSDLPVDFLNSRLDLPMDAYRAGSFDVGMVQLDSIRVDVPETLNRVRSLVRRRSTLIESERNYLREKEVDLVVCDIPSFPMEAARAEGLPVVAVGNFAWDWIYEEFVAQDPAWSGVVEAFQEGYAGADVLLRLPFAEPMKIFSRQEDVPLVASRGVGRRDEIAEAYHRDAGKAWVLLSFTTLDWDARALAAVERLDDYEFFTVLPLAWPGRNFCAVDRHRFSFSDVIASCDLVVSKPGYGILSECVVNDKPLIYAERENFREYPVLEKAIKKHLRHVHIPSEDLYRGALTKYLSAAGSCPPAPEPLATGGDVIAARRILSFIG
jgi:L-arabinokinase